MKTRTFYPGKDSWMSCRNDIRAIDNENTHCVKKRKSCDFWESFCRFESHIFQKEKLSASYSRFNF